MIVEDTLASGDDRVKPQDGDEIEILESINPLIKLEIACGIFRYRLEDGQLRPACNAMKIYGIFIMLILTIPYFLLTYSYTKELPKIYLDIDAIVTVIDNLSWLVTIVLYITSILILFLRSDKHNLQLINVLAHVDCILNISKNIHFFSKSRRHLQILMSVYLIAYVFCCMPDLIFAMEDIIALTYAILIILMDFVRHVELLMFYVFIKMLIDRLEVINKYLSYFVYLKYKKSSKYSDYKANFKINLNYIGDVSEDSDRIRCLAIAYDKIGEATSLINDLFNFQILLSLIATFIYVVITIWSSIHSVRTSQISIILAAIIAANLGLELISICSLTYICEAMSVKRIKTTILVNELVMDYKLPKPMRIQAKAFMELIKVWPLKVSTYDMFSIDVALMLKFISVSTTYLICIIQISHFI